MPKSALTSFSCLARGNAEQIRNCCNEQDLRVWFGAILLEKFNAEDHRAKKAWAWCSTVGRKYMLREGASKPFRPDAAALGESPEWIRKAARSGAPLTVLSLESRERELFSSILDWMRSADGPALNSDWSKISVPQAQSAELAWIDAMVKSSKKKDLDLADASGTQIFLSLGPRSDLQQSFGGPASDQQWAGWRWAQVLSADALDREGSLMRHCVGSYAESVASGAMQIYSLRDPSNAPKLTVEADGSELVQIKAYANSACPANLRPAVAAFAHAFEDYASTHELGAPSASEELGKAGVVSLPGLGLVVERLSNTQADALGEISKNAASGSTDAKTMLGSMAPGLAGLGLSGDLAVVLPFSAKPCLAKALETAARNGHAECVRMLIANSHPNKESLNSLIWDAAKQGYAECVALFLPLVESKTYVQLALHSAALNGHSACLKLLIAASDPKANNIQALEGAACSGHVECVQLLIGSADPKPQNSSALCQAASNGHIACVKLLILASDPKAYGSEALSLAARNGHAECVKLLIPVSEPQANLSNALRAAARGGHEECVKLLLPSSNPLSRERGGYNALQLALDAGFREIAALVLSFIESEFAEKNVGEVIRARGAVARAFPSSSTHGPNR